MEKQYKCTNYGVCIEADKETIFQEAELEEVDGKLVCPKCGQEVEEIKKKVFPWKTVAAIVIAAVVIGAGIFLWLGRGEKAPQTVPVESIVISPGEIIIEQTDSVQLTASVMPENATDKDVLWESSDSGVVNILDQNGSIMACGVGTAQVTATVDDKTTVCTVTVTAKPVPVDSVIIAPAQVSLKKNDTTQLSVTVVPENATDKSVVWESSNDSVIKLSDQNGNIQACGEGTAQVTATVGGKTAVCAVTVKKESSNPNGGGNSGSGSYDLGWGLYKGPKSGGVPHGLDGEVTVRRYYTLDLKKGGETRDLSPGDKITGCKFKDGRFVSGYIHYRDGSGEKVIIGVL